MLFDSVLRKDLSRSFGGTLVVILTIVLTMLLIRTLGLAAGGRVSPQDVALLLGYTMLGYLPTVLCLSLFVAVVSVLLRMYRDSEMAVWFASGLSLQRFVAPVLRFAAPVLLAVAALVLVIWPWSSRNSVELRDRYEQRSDLSRVAPGQFQTSANGQRVFFIDKQAPQERTGRNVFILDQREGRESVTTAQAGRIELRADGSRDLVLENGARTDLDLLAGTRTLSRFDSYVVRISEQVMTHLQEAPPKTRSTLDLLTSRDARVDAELAWRAGLILAAVNLPLLGIGLCSGGPRQGAGSTLVLALLSFMVYLNMVNLSQAWVGRGRIGLGAGLLAVHGTALLLAVGLIWWRDSGSARFCWPWRAGRT